MKNVNNRLVSEAGDTDLEKEIAPNFNALADALKWFFENGVKVDVKHKKTGYTITFGIQKAPRR